MKSDENQPPFTFGSMDRYKRVPFSISATAILQADGTLRLDAKNPEEQYLIDEWVKQNKEDGEPC